MAQKSSYIWPEIGNASVVEFLEKSLASGQVAQSYIFVGPADLGKFTMALSLAANLQDHPQGFNSDLHILDLAEGQKNISIVEVREFIKTLNLSSFNNSYKIGIIKQADLLSEGAKSALLKTLEEPQDKVVIILLSTEEENLPATILSRSQILYFYPVAATVIYDYLLKNYQLNRSLARDLANLSLGKPLLAVKLWEKPDEYKAYLEIAEKWLDIISSEVNTRLSILNIIFKDKTWSKQATDSARHILTIAEGLGRDLLLLHWDQPERIQHSVLADNLTQVLESLNKISENNPVPFILKQLKLIAQARNYLDANVNPRLVLEQVIINL